MDIINIIENMDIINLSNMMVPSYINLYEYVAMNNKDTDLLFYTRVFFNWLSFKFVAVRSPAVIWADSCCSRAGFLCCGCGFIFPARVFMGLPITCARLSAFVFLF